MIYKQEIVALLGNLKSEIICNEFIEQAEFIIENNQKRKFNQNNNNSFDNEEIFYDALNVQDWLLKDVINKQIYELQLNYPQQESTPLLNDSINNKRNKCYMSCIIL